MTDDQTSGQLERYGGLASVVAGVVCLVQTPFMVAVWNFSPPGTDWSQTPLLARLVGPYFESSGLLTFAPDPGVYYAYGRVFILVYLLLIPGVIAFRRKYQLSTTLGGAGYWMHLAGLVVALLGDLATYWGGGAEFTRLQQLGFGVELVGLLGVLVGIGLLGVGLVRQRDGWRSVGWSFVFAGPIGIALSLWVVAYVPNGPMIPVAVSWSAVGYSLWVDSGDPRSENPLTAR